MSRILLVVLVLLATAGAGSIAGGQNSQVLGVQQVAMLFEKLLAVVANDIGHLVGWPLAHGLV